VLGHVQRLVPESSFVKDPKVPKGKNQSKKKTSDDGVDEKPKYFFGKWIRFQKSIQEGLRDSEKKKQRTDVHEYVVLNHMGKEEKVLAQGVKR
jgi:hypothetical protein